MTKALQKEILDAMGYREPDERCSSCRFFDTTNAPLGFEGRTFLGACTLAPHLPVSVVAGGGCKYYQRLVKEEPAPSDQEAPWKV